MKVHIHTPSFFPSLVGMTYAAHVHATLLRELGADVTVIAPRAETDGISEVIDYAVRHFDVSGSGLPWSRLDGDIDELLRFNAEEQPDIVIAEGWFTTGAVLLPRFKQHARHVILSSHGSADLFLEQRRPSHFARAMAYRWEESTRSRAIMRQLSAAIVLSSWEDRFRFQDVRRFRRHQVPLYVCPNSSTYAPTMGHALSAERVNLIHVGEMKPHKSPETAVRVLAALPERFHLTLAFPRETSHLSLVKAIADQAGIRHRLHFIIGRKRSELEATMAASDVLLITSPSKDVQPIVAVDALAKGVPFVSTNVGCMPEFGGGIVTTSDRMALAVLDICDSDASYWRFSQEACAYRERSLSPAIARASRAKLLSDLDA